MNPRPVPSGARPTGRVLWRGDAQSDKREAAGRPGDFLTLLSRAWRNVGLYGTAHPVAQAAINDLGASIRQALSNRPALRLYIQDDTFFEDGRVLLEESLRFYSLLTAFRQRLIGAVQVSADVERVELQHLIELLNVKPDELERSGGAEAYLRGCGVQRITVGAVVAGSGAGVGDAEKDDKTQGDDGRKARGGTVRVDPQDAYRAGLRVMDELTYRASVDLPLNLAKARTVVNYFLDILNDDRAALLGISALRKYDEDTYHHSVNVCVLSLLLASQLNMDRAQLVVVGLAALLHDIGKMRVPHNIITKPGRLTPDEMNVVKRHPVHGAHILRDLADVTRLAMVVAFEHHAGHNLSGYPQITAKKAPHLISRIVTVADCFDAMTSARRAYRTPKRVDEALKEIFQGAGTVFDPVLAKLFCKSCRPFLTVAADAAVRREASGSASASPQ